jgi:hypothetical protein
MAKIMIAIGARHEIMATKLPEKKNLFLYGREVGIPSGKSEVRIS